MTTQKSEIDAALLAIDAVRSAPGRYAVLLKKIAHAKANEPEQMDEAIAHYAALRELEKQAAALAPVATKNREALNAALAELRQINGVQSTRLVTEEIGKLALERLEQGYSLSAVAMMIGCASSTVANLKSGRYVFSKLPDDCKIGSRGQRNVF